MSNELARIVLLTSAIVCIVKFLIQQVITESLYALYYEVR